MGDWARSESEAQRRLCFVSMALYRRYRPERFQDVIGQEQVTRPLMAALRGGRTVHAYLFSGPRGCGKTTSARIFARCLNCAKAPTDTPCGECESCRDLANDGPGSLDVVEMDAASHGGVDDARDLVERAAFAPARDRFKIFIIDEAHMVTTQGFNALLKLVEEPPPHIKFIFATTEPEKVIGTIRSRTHHYPFRLVAPDTMESYLAGICAEEGFLAGPGVLGLVVRAGAGSVRDSMSVLDQLMGGAEDKTLDYEQAIGLLGYTDSAMIDRAVEAIASEDGGRLFAVVEELIGAGHEPRRFVEDLLQRLRDLVVIGLAGQAATDALGSLPQDRLERMREQARALGAERATYSAEQTNEVLSQMTGATSPRLQLELLCARLLLPAYEKRGKEAGGPSAPGRPAASPELARVGGAPEGSGYRPAAAGAKSAQEMARERAIAAARNAATSREHQSGQEHLPSRGNLPSWENAGVTGQGKPGAENPLAQAGGESGSPAQAQAEPARREADVPGAEAEPARAETSTAGEKAQESGEQVHQQPAAESNAAGPETPDLLAVVQKRWPEIISSGRFAQAIFEAPAKAVSQAGDVITIEFSGERAFHALEDERNLQRLNAHISMFTEEDAGRPVTVRPVRQSADEAGDASPKAEAAPGAAAPTEQTSPRPAAQMPRVIDEEHSDEPPLPEEIVDEDSDPYAGYDPYAQDRSAATPGAATPFVARIGVLANIPAAGSGQAEAQTSTQEEPEEDVPFYMQRMPMPKFPQAPSAQAPAPGASEDNAPGSQTSEPPAPNTQLAAPQGPSARASEPQASSARAEGGPATSSTPGPVASQVPRSEDVAFHVPTMPKAQHDFSAPKFSAMEAVLRRQRPGAGSNSAGSPVPDQSPAYQATANQATASHITVNQAPANSEASPGWSGSPEPEPAEVDDWGGEESVSADDPTIEQSSVVGIEVVLKTFEGTIIEETSDQQREEF